MTIDLSKPLAWTHASPEEGDMLADLQANILKGHGRRHVHLHFLGFAADGANEAKAFLGRLPLSDALTQLQDARAFRASARRGGLITLCWLSFKGYLALGAGAKAPTSAAFRDGMGARHALLQDPAESKWEAPYQRPIHAVILLAHDHEAVLLRASNRLLRSLPDSIEALHREVGRTYLSQHAPGHGIEHFGFVDGRSQPLMLKEDVDREGQTFDGTSVWNPSIGPELALVRDPGAKGPAGHGSFFVFRKLEQDVRAFRAAERRLASALGLKGSDRARAGAAVVGRFRNGTPLVAQSVPGAPKPIPNNFDYRDDPLGLKCPFHAHVRKVNPRGETAGTIGSPASERVHAIVRRGIPYGVRLTAPDDVEIPPHACPKRGVGLLFMACQASIERQFEFMQAKWANDAQFLSPKFVSGGPLTGIDPIMGQLGSNDSSSISEYLFPVQWGGSPAQAERRPFSMAQFVRMLGGEYFFAPAISTLQNL